MSGTTRCCPERQLRSDFLQGWWVNAISDLSLPYLVDWRAESERQRPPKSSQSFPLTPVTKIHGWHSSCTEIDSPNLLTLEGLEIVLNLIRIPMPSHDPKISDIGSQMLPKTSKMTPKSDPTTRKSDFQKHVFYYSKTWLFEVTTPSKPTKETSPGVWSAFWHHKYEKVSQLAPKCLPMRPSRRSKIHWISIKNRLRLPKGSLWSP